MKNAQDILDNIKVNIVVQIKRLNNLDNTESNQGEMKGYMNVLSSMGVPDDDIMFIVSHCN